MKFIVSYRSQPLISQFAHKFMKEKDLIRETLSGIVKLQTLQTFQIK